MQTANQDGNDVYSNKKVHIDYMDAVAKGPAEHELCSACFFERFALRSFTQV